MIITNVMTGQVSEYGIEVSGPGTMIDVNTSPAWLDNKTFMYVAINHTSKKQPSDALINAAKRSVQNRKGTVYTIEV